MRILTGIDVPFQPFGGSLICCDDWYSELPAGVEVRFLTLSPPAGQGHWWLMKDVVFLDIEKSRTPDGFMAYVDKLKLAVKAQIEDYEPDIVHSQHLNYGLARAFAEAAGDVPKIGICHGTDVQAAVGNPFFKDNMKTVCDGMDSLIFPNRSMADDFFAVYDKPKDYDINPLGIPDGMFRHRPAGQEFDGSRPLKLLYAGRLLKWKGADIAVESMTLTARPVELTVIGNEDQAGYKAAMTGFVAGHGLENRVRFIDQLPRRQLVEAFDEYDAIVFPSTGLEAFSLTLVEAQARGLPVLYSPDGGGIVDTAGGSGIRLPSCTPAGLAATIDLVYSDPNRLEQARTTGYANAEKYRISASRDRLLDISRSLIGNRAG